MMTESVEETIDLMKEFPRSYSSNLSSDLDASVLSRIIRSSAFSCFFALIAWHYPRYLINKESYIASKVPPYQQTQAGDVILDFNLNQPLVDPPTIPSTFLVWASVWIPLLLLIALAARNSRPQRLANAATAVGGFAMAIGLSEGTTVLLKLWIQRPRPNFYSLCGFDKSLLKCTADLHHLREANFSFPSGHSSLSCCGMTFLVWYLLGNQNGKRTIVYALNAILPWGWTIFVAASRIADSWHHPSDVLAGLGLGFITCTIAYHTWYPPVWSKFAGIPRGLSRMDTDDNNNKLPSFSE